MEFSSDFFKENRRELQNWMAEDSLCIIYSGTSVPKSQDSMYKFSVNNNFYYLTGICEEGLVLLLTKDKATLFIHPIDMEQEKWNGKKIRLETAQKISGINQIEEITVLQNRLKEKSFSKIYRDFTIKTHEKQKLQEALGLVIDLEDCADVFPQLANQRVIKSQEEIDALKQAIKITHCGINAIKKILTPNIMEYELQAEFEYQINKVRSWGTSFDTIVAGGKNGPILHYIENSQPLLKGDLVLLDLGARYQGYCGDISRTYSVDGQMTDEQAILYDIVLQTQIQLISEYKVGNSMAKLQSLTKTLFSERLMEKGFIRKAEEVDHYYYHGVGHSLGIDTHDVGYKSMEPFKAGMVMTCEPGLYFADRGIGIRIEDDILITESGPINLSNGIYK